MTNDSIKTQVTMCFLVLYPKANIVVRGEGSEEILVAVQHGTDYIQYFKAEIDSDDDGYFHFLDEDVVDLEILVRYPES